MGTFIGLTVYVLVFLKGVLGLRASQFGVALVPLRVGAVTGATLATRRELLQTTYSAGPQPMPMTAE